MVWIGLQLIVGWEHGVEGSKPLGGFLRFQLSLSFCCLKRWENKNKSDTRDCTSEIFSSISLLSRVENTTC
jgi:hypothetical protein